jgi:hypothetical protein
MMHNERRRFFRHPFSYPLKVSVHHREQGRQEHRFSAENIGGGGLLFRSSHCFPQGLVLEIFLMVEKHSFTIDGKVVRCEELDNGCYMIAVGFENSHDLLKARLAEQAVRIELFKERLERRHHVTLDLACVAREWIKRYSTAFAHDHNL